MKKLTLTISAMFLIIGLNSSCKPSFDGENQSYQMLEAAKDSLWNQEQKLNQQAKLIAEQEELIKLFENYYNSTEDLLDSLPINPDTDLETDAGAQYLEDRYNLNQLYNKLQLLNKIKPNLH